MGRQMIFFLATLILLNLVVLQPASVHATPADSDGVSGFVFHVISNENNRVNAILDGSIDLIYDRLSDQYPSLTSSSEVSVVGVPRNGYGYLTLNCKAWPLNYPALRRAIALAVNKTMIADMFSWGADPVDAVLPVGNPFTAEGTFARTYYDADLAAAASLLDSAGFVDTNSDGYREAPNGTAFSIEIISADTSGSLTHNILSHVQQQLDALGIHSTLEYALDWSSRISVTHDYGIAFLGKSFDMLDPLVLCEFMSDGFANNLATGQFSNATFDSKAALLKATLSETDAATYAAELQQILFEQCPIIPLYTNYFNHAYRNDVGGLSSHAGEGLTSRWSLLHSYFESTASDTDNLDIAIANDIFSFNPIESSKGQSGVVNNLIWDRLLMIDDAMEVHAGLATSWAFQLPGADPSLSPGEMAIVFTIRNDSVWTDGSPVTTQDVAASFNFIADSWFTTNLHLNDLDRAEVISNETVKVVFNSRSFFHLWYAGNAPILPKATLDKYNPDKIDLWDPVPGPSGDLVTSGPYMVSKYVAGDYIALVRNPHYYLQPENLPNTSISTTTTSGATNHTSGNYTTPLMDVNLLTMGFAVGAVVVVVAVGVIFLRRE